MLLRLAVSIFLIEQSINPCLSAGQLLILGLTPQNRTIYSGGSLCSSFYSTTGGCADIASVTQKLVDDMAVLRQKMSIMSQLYTIFDVVGGILKNAALNMTSTSTNTTLPGGSSNYTVEQITADLGYIKGNATQNYPKCFDTLAQLQTGATCLLSSGSATQGAIADGGIFNVSINAVIDGPRVESDCLPVYDAICTIISGKSLVYNSVNGTIPSMTDMTMKFASACKSLRPYYNCSINATCVLEKQQKFISTLIRPYDYDIFPTLNLAATMGVLFKSVGNQFKQFFSVGALSTASTNRYVYFNAITSGNSIYAIGNSSGISPPGVLRASIAVVVSLVMLCLL